jgi:hypothetical protein
VYSHLLIEFLFRLTLGIATAMAVTSARQVTSGFFRVHLWVLMGLQTLAALALYSVGQSSPLSWIGRSRLGFAIAAAIASYVGAVIWMYERPRPGKAAIVFVAACGLAGSWLPVVAMLGKPISLYTLQLADRLTGSLLLGLVTTSMLLGHWYLNTPTMKLEPLRRLLCFLAIGVALRMMVCAVGAWIGTTHALSGGAISPDTWYLFLALRWLSGLIGVAALTWLTWQTLKIPNTQSATGILYAAVVLACIGELTSQLLSAGTRYPV